jgi:hypothetical protein
MVLVRFEALCIMVYVLDSLVYLTTLLQVHSDSRNGRKLSALENKELNREVGEKYVVSRFIGTLLIINIMRLIMSSRAS